MRRPKVAASLRPEPPTQANGTQSPADQRLRLRLAKVEKEARDERQRDGGSMATESKEGQGLCPVGDCRGCHSVLTMECERGCVMEWVYGTKGVS